MAPSGSGPFRIGPIRDGFMGEVNVFNLRPELLTIQTLMDDLRLSGYCEIVVFGECEPRWLHFSGPNFGPFERHFVDLREMVLAMEATIGKLP